MHMIGVIIEIIYILGIILTYIGLRIYAIIKKDDVPQIICFLGAVTWPGYVIVILLVHIGNIIDYIISGFVKLFKRK